MARARKYISHGGKTFIDDPSKLESIMELGAKGFITQIAQNTAKRLKYNTAELIYNGYEPKKYKRTKELLDSIQGPGINGGAPTKKTATGFKAIVRYNANLVTTRILGHGHHWGTHTSFSHEKTNSVIYAIIYGFEELGFDVEFGGKTIYYRDPVGMISKTVEEIDEYLDGFGRTESISTLFNSERISSGIRNIIKK